MDVTLQNSVSSFLNCAVSVLWSLVVVVAVSPSILAAIVPLSVSYYYLQVRRQLYDFKSLAPAVIS